MPSEPDFLTVDELAARYGVSVRTVYQWNSTGKGPRRIPVGRYVRYRLADVLAWEAARIKEPTEATA